VTDDILDVEEIFAALGKTAGKDMAQQKATYPAVYGLERSHQIGKRFGNQGHLLSWLPTGIVPRASAKSRNFLCCAAPNTSSAP